MSTAVATAPVTTTRQEVEDLIHAYVQCIDDDRLEEWPDFFADDCLYKVIPRENADLGLPVARQHERTARLGPRQGLRRDAVADAPAERSLRTS